MPTAMGFEPKTPEWQLEDIWTWLLTDDHMTTYNRGIIYVIPGDGAVFVGTANPPPSAANRMQTLRFSFRKERVIRFGEERLPNSFDGRSTTGRAHGLFHFVGVLACVVLWNAYRQRRGRASDHTNYATNGIYLNRSRRVSKKHSKRHLVTKWASLNCRLEERRKV